jgi:hypothetical protein
MANIVSTRSAATKTGRFEPWMDPGTSAQRVVSHRFSHQITSEAMKAARAVKIDLSGGTPRALQA